MKNPKMTSAPQITTPTQLVIRDLGRMSYQEAYDIQRELQKRVIQSRENASDGSKPREMYLLLVEHDPPVITVSRRKGARQHLVATDAQLRDAGVQVVETDRGGDITYHGPGQLVVYPILDLNVLNLRLHGYMRFLEQMVIDTLGKFGIAGVRDPNATGVWVKQNDETTRADPSPSRAPPELDYSGISAKICALGVRVSRWVTMHGLALNVTTNLDHFNLIVPCGLAGRSVTSMKSELGTRCPSINDVKKHLVDQFNFNLADSGVVKCVSTESE